MKNEAREVRKLTSLAMDGRLDRGGIQRLEQLLRVEGMLDEYVEMVRLESALERTFGQKLLESIGDETGSTPCVVRPLSTGGAGATPGGKPIGLVKAIIPYWIPGLIGIGVLAAIWSLIAFLNGPFATIVDAQDVVWSDAQGTPFQVGDGVSNQWLDLEEGKVQVAFENGALVSVRGPARFRAKSSRLTELVTGALDIHVPAKAAGFAVDTARFSIVDLGTDFRVHAARQDAGEVEATVFVKRGRVRVEDRADDATVEVVQGEVLRGKSASDWQVMQVQKLAPKTTRGTTFHEKHVDSLGFGAFNRNNEVALFLESCHTTLPFDVTLDIGVSGRYSDFHAQETRLSEGTVVDSYLLHYAPESGRTVVKGTLRFTRPVLGIICTSDRLNATNDVLGSHWTLNCSHPQRGLESTPDVNSDVITLSEDRKQISYLLKTERAIDQIRIIVGSEYARKSQTR